jgi:hypothetical protein
MSGLSAFAAAPGDWAGAKLIAGQRVEVQHGGKIERGIYSLTNADEIVISTSKVGLLAVPRSEVERVIRKGTDAPNLSYFQNARDQLFPKDEVVYERAGAAAPSKKKK